MPLYVLALLTVRNESDYIQQCLEHLFSQGINVCLIDNGSTDDTVAKASAFLPTGQLQIEHLPYKGYFELSSILENEVRLSKLIPADWYIHHDADEIRYAPEGMGSLREAIEAVDSQGFNAINFDEFVFLPPESAKAAVKDYEAEFTDYYYFAPRPIHRLNAWKNTGKEIDLVTHAGHKVEFDGIKIYPEAFTLKHYIGLTKNKIIAKYASRVYSIEEMLNRNWHGERASFSHSEINWPHPKELKVTNEPRARNLDKSTPLTSHPFLVNTESRPIENAQLLLRRKQAQQNPLARLRETLAQQGLFPVKNKPIPFVVGVMRSGTTLLRLMLDAHPDLAIPAETRFFPALAPLVNKAPIEPEEIVNLLTSINTWPDFELDSDILLQRMHQSGVNNTGHALRVFYEAYAERLGKKRWGDKTPYYCLHMDQINTLFPETRFIHIIRDGRDVALSTKGLWFDLGKTIEETAVNWANRIRQTRQLAQLVPHYMELRYEDLITEPETALRKICKFIHLPYNPAMLEYHQTAHRRLDEFKSRYSEDGEVTVSKEQRKAAFRLASAPPQKDRIERWRNELSQEQIEQFEAVAGPLLKELNYSLLYDNPK
jgi:hypothetical protein